LAFMPDGSRIVTGGMRDGTVTRTARVPEDYGLKRCKPEDLAGGDANHNAIELVRVFGREDQGAHRDALVMSTSLVLEVQGAAKDARQGVEIAVAAIDNGDAMALLNNMQEHFAHQ